MVGQFEFLSIFMLLVSSQSGQREGVRGVDKGSGRERERRAKGKGRRPRERAEGERYEKIESGGGE